MVILDTNVVIYLLQKDDKIVQYFQNIIKDNEDIAISCITKIELLSFPKLQKKEEADIYHFLKFVDCIIINDDIINETIHLKKTYNIKIPDAIIAATVLTFNGVLLTRNTKDFLHIKRLKMEEI